MRPGHAKVHGISKLGEAVGPQQVSPSAGGRWPRHGRRWLCGAAPQPSNEFYDEPQYPSKLHRVPATWIVRFPVWLAEVSHRGRSSGGSNRRRG